MNRIMASVLTQLRQTLRMLVVGLTILVSLTLGQLGYTSQVQAAPLTPEATQYQVDRSDRQVIQPSEQPNQSGESFIDTVREKLNLDEPLPESTKAFFKQLQGEDVTVTEEIPSGKGEEPSNE